MKAIAKTVSVLTAAVLLASCSNNSEQSDANNENQDPQAKAAATGTPDPAQFDTGEYVTTFRTPYLDPEDPDYPQESLPETGHFMESFEIGRHLLLPYEVDEKYVVGGGSQHAYPLGRISGRALTSDQVDVLEPLSEKLQSGYAVYSTTPGYPKSTDGNEANVLVLRYSSPEIAKQAAELLRKDDLTPADDGPGVQHFEFASPAVNVAYASAHNWETLEQTSLEVVATHDEFMIVNYLKEASAPEGRKEALDFLDKYYKAAVPLLDKAQTHKTDEGYGKLKTWPKIDNDEGLLRYAVPVPASEDMIDFPHWINQRLDAVDQTETDVVLSALKQAGIESGATAQSKVLKARNGQGAESFRSTLLSVYLEDDFKEYKEPQNIPNTKCVERFSSSYVHYECFMINGEFVAQLTAADSNIHDDKDVKKELSQRTAAQYLIFEDAKNNPRGTAPEKEESVFNDGSSTETEVSVTKKDNGSFADK